MRNLLGRLRAGAAGLVNRLRGRTTAGARRAGSPAQTRSTSSA